MGDVKTTDMEVIRASLPVDRNALRGVLPGVHFKPVRKDLQEQRPDCRARENPMKIRRDSVFPEIRRQMKEFTGKTFGKWTVVGYAKHQPPGKLTANWVVKCSCSRYEMRKLRSIRKASQTGDCCWECRNLQNITRSFEYFKNNK